LKVPTEEARRKVYSVSELNRLAKAVLENELGEVWVEGEISGFKRHSSGHMYFEIKDERETARISAALFRGDQRALKVTLRDGMKIRALGRVTVFERYGRYQIVVRLIEEAGEGALREAFEKLKRKLAAEGLFDQERKKPIPALPRHVGIVTSQSGAALRDILNVIGRRFPNLHLVLAPVKVQGEGAAAEISAAIEQLNQLQTLDVMIVGRGGGSLEDLWAYNEESVARAIAASRVPIISAVGHEIDFTISDFVADLRAPTPSAAAELVVSRKEEIEQRLRELRTATRRALNTRLLELKNRLTAASKSYVFREPGNLVKRFRERLRGLHTRQSHAARSLLQQSLQRLDEAQLRFAHGLLSRHAGDKQRLELLAQHLGALNPKAVLERGYSITRKSGGPVVRSAGEVAVGERLQTVLAEGRIQSEVVDHEPGGTNGRKGK